MVRVVTQILIGLMLLFGALNLARKAISSIASGNIPKGLYFLLLFGVAVFFSILAFYYAYSGMTEIWPKA